MSTAARVAALADHLRVSLGITVHADPSVTTGRGDVWAFVDAPTFTYDDAAGVLCPAGREPRLTASVVVVGAGTAPGQAAGLYDAADAVIAALADAPGWSIGGNVTPGEWSGSPVYSVPVTTG